MIVFQTIHIGIRCTTGIETREAVNMFRTVLHFHPDGLFHLHIGVNDHTRKIWETLLNTWQLPQGNAQIVIERFETNLRIH